jgi:hypothetical protein
LHSVLDQPSSRGRRNIHAAAKSALEIEVRLVRRGHGISVITRQLMQRECQRNSQRRARTDTCLAAVHGIKENARIESQFKATLPIKATGSPDMLKQFEFVARIQPTENSVTNKKTAWPIDMARRHDNVMLFRRRLYRHQRTPVYGHADGGGAIQDGIFTRQYDFAWRAGVDTPLSHRQFVPRHRQFR